MWDLLHLVLLLCVGNATSICLFRQLCKGRQNRKLNVKTFSTAEAAMGQKKHPLQIFYKIDVLNNFRKIHRKTSVLKYPFNKFKVYNFIEKGLQYMRFPVSFARFLRRPFLKNTSRRLLLCGPYFWEIFLC